MQPKSFGALFLVSESLLDSRHDAKCAVALSPEWDTEVSMYISRMLGLENLSAQRSAVWGELVMDHVTDDGGRSDAMSRLKRQCVPEEDLCAQIISPYPA